MKWGRAVIQGSEAIRSRLRIPAIAAPMFLVSGPDLVLAACRAGIVGSFPANNARTIDELDAWMTTIAAGAREMDMPWAINIMVHRTYERTAEELELVLKHKPPVVITALGSPKQIVAAIQGYGGMVFADVNSISYARKAAEIGVDGLVLVSAGAGGHTGQLSAFAFVPAVREFFDGVIVLGGAIGSGRAVRAAEILGADFAYLGTRLIASEESIAHADYKQMLIDASADDIILSASLTGVPANWLRASLLAAGYDPANMGPKAEIGLGRPESEAAKRWRDVWSAGQGVGAVRLVEKVSGIIDELAAEYEAVKG
ncbi:MAG: nitronate monooxygenase [Alphaproteobacteria bacterium]|nr:nitronate monooxygenase [Alphaproteobacteria bacterium]MBU1512501.1 nitronate monooxygenase [Alphaproteobacteria bacterium]MBU2096575.1 nitronate monooxygenase [Alphaproteobacteria bacterium]MBU2151607.1 nitronate monooxygenase [Alphaproteobacteria bacterium]MBU2307325.1 nitronate monooxygenase [Alphaproteobacteria bacterium]